MLYLTHVFRVLRSKVPVSSQHDFSVLLVTAGKSELPYMSIRNDVEGCT